ncbi:MAG: response regulator [Nocardioides sp.]
MDVARLYRDIVETSPDGIWVFTLDGRTLYANPQVARMFGVDPEEACDLNYLDTLDEVGQGQFADHLADLREGRFNTGEVESQFVRRDGSTFWVLVREHAMRDPDGNVTGVVHRISDYTDRRSRVDRLSESERRLAEAQRIARIGSWEWDVEKDEITGSQELYDLYGLDPESFPAAYADFMEIVHPDDRRAVHTAVQRAVQGAPDFMFVARVAGRDGEWVWTRGRGVSLHDGTGRVVAMSGTHQDITETKMAELALEDSVTQNALMQAVATAANEARTLEDVLSQAGALVMLHDDWERGRAFVPSADGRGVVPLYIFDADEDEDGGSPEVAAAELALANRAFHEHRTLWDDDRLTIAFNVSYGQKVCAVVTITSAPPLYRHAMIQSMVEQVAVQLGFVAEREAAERDLAQARDGAMEASRQKSEFLATMSHEIRTPLNGVIGLNDLLLRTDLTSDQLRLASGVQVASRALLSVINDILDFSKIEAGRLELERLDFEVRSVFDQVAGVLGESARAKGLELVVSCDPAVPEMLNGDPTRLAQVLTNLGSNAVKFTEEGQVLVRATAAPDPAGRTLLRVEVADTGVGVQDTDVGALFDPFTQADASTTRIYGGTGLGLAISREIVEALGGTIGLEHNPGGGSVFWFTALLDPADERPHAPDEDYARGWLAGRRVLVVDDNPASGDVLREQLAWWRLRADAVGSADDALAALAAAVAVGDAYDGVLVDMEMPGRDGLDLAQDLRRDAAYDGLALLLLTTAPVADGARLEEARVSECLPKPVLTTSLRSALLEHLAGVGPRHSTPVEESEEVRKRHRVLVVEDNPVNQMVAVGLLEALGYDAVTADDGRAAVELLRSDTAFDLVLMDVQMPRMDGYAATRAIRERPPGEARLPVVAMTAAAVEGERDRCLAAGMDDFLTKPVDPAALAAVLDRWIADAPPPTPPTAPVDQQKEAPVAEREPIDGLDEPRLDELRELDPSMGYLNRAIGNFCTNTPETLETIRAAYATGDAGTLKAVVHKLAGGALNLGVTPAGRTAQQIELLTDDGTVDGAHDLIEQLAVQLEAGREALRAYQAAYPPVEE